MYVAKTSLAYTATTICVIPKLEHAADDRGGDRPYSAQIFRVDSVQLNDIHGIIMSLVRTAEKLGGKYDGWETSVEKP